MTQRFSVVTAVRNARRTVGDSLASVACQTYGQKEHVIQDGVSTDGTLEVIRATSTPIVKLESIADSGVYDAFNRGLQRTSGDVISFLGADDTYETDKVLAEVAAAFGDPDVDIVFGDALVVSRADSLRVIRFYSSSDFRGVRSLRRGFMPAHTATFVRRRVFDRVGVFNTTYKIAGDFEWLVRAFRQQQLNWVHVPKPLVRMRAGGLSSSGVSSAWSVTKEFRRACLSNEIPSGYFTLLSRLPIKALGLVRRGWDAT